MMRAAALLILTATASGASFKEMTGRFTPEETQARMSQEREEYMEMLQNMTDKMNADAQAEGDVLNPMNSMKALLGSQGKNMIKKELGSNMIKKELGERSPQEMNLTPEKENLFAQSSKPAPKGEDWQKKLAEIVADAEYYNNAPAKIVPTKWLGKNRKKDLPKRNFKSSNPTNRGYNLPANIAPLWAWMMEFQPVNSETNMMKGLMINMICTEFPSTEGCTAANIASCREIGDCTTGKETYVWVGDEIYKVAKGFGVSKKEAVSRTAFVSERLKGLRSQVNRAASQSMQATGPAEDIIVEAIDTTTQKEERPDPLGGIIRQFKDGRKTIKQGATSK